MQHAPVQRRSVRGKGFENHQRRSRCDVVQHQVADRRPDRFVLHVHFFPALDARSGSAGRRVKTFVEPFRIAEPIYALCDTIYPSSMDFARVIRGRGELSLCGSKLWTASL